MSKEQYDTLLKKLGLDDSFHEHENTPSCLSSIEEYPELAADQVILPQEEIPLPEYPFGSVSDELNIILKSKIFRNGQLKGRQLTGHARLFKSYEIYNLEEFIWLLCDKIHNFQPVDEDERIYYDLSNLLNAIEGSGHTIKHFFGKREATQLSSLSEKVRTWLNTMKESSSQFSIPERVLTKQITDVFKKYIPNAPEETIYVGVCNFLELFDVDCNPKTLAVREYRRKKAQSLR